MPTPQSEPIVTEMRKLLKQRRLQLIDAETNKPLSLRKWASQHNLDASMVSRLENPDTENRIPSITFWIDYCIALKVDLGELQTTAMKNTK